MIGRLPAGDIGCTHGPPDEPPERPQLAQPPVDRRLVACLRRST